MVKIDKGDRIDCNGPTGHGGRIEARSRHWPGSNGQTGSNGQSAVGSASMLLRPRRRLRLLRLRRRRPLLCKTAWDQESPSRIRVTCHPSRVRVLVFRVACTRDSGRRRPVAPASDPAHVNPRPRPRQILVKPTVMVKAINGQTDSNGQSDINGQTDSNGQSDKKWSNRHLPVKATIMVKPTIMVKAIIMVKPSPITAKPHIGE